MTIAHRLEAQGIIAAAHRAGATLPADLLDRAARLDDLDRLATDRANVSHHVLDLAATLDADPDTFHAALDRAALDLAASEHRATLLAATIDRASSLLRADMRRRGDKLATAFAKALAPQLDALSETAGTLPATFAAGAAADLDPDTFAAWTRARDAHAALHAAATALAPLYADTRPDDLLAPAAVVALRWAEPPADLDPADAHRFARALAGTHHGGSHVGPVNVTGVFAPAALAATGARFVWATPTEVAARAAALHAAVTPAPAMMPRPAVVLGAP